MASGKDRARNGNRFIRVSDISMEKKIQEKIARDMRSEKFVDVDPEVRKLHWQGYLPSQIAAMRRMDVSDVKRQVRLLGQPPRREYVSGRPRMAGY